MWCGLCCSVSSAVYELFAVLEKEVVFKVLNVYNNSVLHQKGDSVTKEELKRLQSLPLEDKIALTKLRITEFYEQNNGNIVISYSGGGDSSVLLHLTRQLYPEAKGVFCDTGLEFPEVKEHVKNTENIEIIRPSMSYKQVLDRYGFVYPSKEVSRIIYYARKGSQWAIYKLQGKNKDGEDDFYAQRFKNYAYLLDAPFKMHDQCCRVLKKDPFSKYVRNHNNVGMILGTRAEESVLRTQSYLKTGCINTKKNSATPIAFWMFSDILNYIVKYKVKIPTIYGEVKNGKYSGVQRTGCIFCPIGGIDEILKEKHPKLYTYCMETLGLRKLYEWVAENKPKSQTLYTSKKEFDNRL